MKNIFYSFILTGFSLLSYSQKIKGVITDNDGRPLPYASVFIKENNKGTTANSEGSYAIKLEPGRYTLVCQHVGYAKAEKIIVLANTDIELDFRLLLQEVTLGEVVLKNGEDPAYEIIRKAIAKRKYFQGQLDKFQCQVYTKGRMQVRNFPKKILGRKVDFEDGDTSKQKFLYLSETIANYYVDKPNKEKIEVISSKVSGQTDGFGLSAPRFFSLYDNNIFIGNNLNPRGFISPVSDNALNYYRYKFEGTFFEDGREISRIKVIPRRPFEPLFEGIINIIEDEWRIHSLQLLLTKKSQLEILDTLRLEQIYRPLNRDIWYIASQVIYPTIRILGFDAYGSFVNIYSGFNVEPLFTKKTFDHTLLKYTDSSNKRTTEYWENIRPLPLMPDEIHDYKKKDSLEQVRKEPRYIDSLDKVRNKLSPVSAVLIGQTFIDTRKRVSMSLPPLMDQVNFNPAEGWLINTGFAWTKKLDSLPSGRRSITLAPNFRYGFSNGHFNTHLTIAYTYGKKYAAYLGFSGGKRVFQFNNNSSSSEQGNSISSLFSENNKRKTYEAVYYRGSFHKDVGEGFSLVAGFQYQNRRALNNTTDYTWQDKPNRTYTPNYPTELLSENIKHHQVFMTLFGLTWQPGARYIELPDRKINIGSKFPVFSAQYMKAFRTVFGSDENFSKWKWNMTGTMNFKLQGKFRYRLGMGGFIDTGVNIQVPDYIHFNRHSSVSATEYLNSFELLPLYQFSNTSRFYAEAHVEHNFKGFLTNKIPGLRKLNLYLVVGGNGLYINPDKNYCEIFAGFDNIFKQFRLDFVQSYINGRPAQNAFRLGFSLSQGQRGDDWP